MNLAVKYRPQTLEDVVGQDHLTNGLIQKFINDESTSFIFYGEPGIGKTTIANIIAKQTNMPIVKINATIHKTKDVQDAIKTHPNGLIMYVDEIQYFTKKQHQLFLEPIESGKLRLIAATTENPYHKVYKALCSRCQIFEFKPITKQAILNRLQTIASLENSEIKGLSPMVMDKIAQIAGGDMRSALTMCDALIKIKESPNEITLDDLASITPGVSGASFDIDGDVHYHLLSAFQKAIRGSEADAALHYLARLLHGGDIISPIRRLKVIVSEDIGLADPYAPILIKSLCDIAEEVGMPEARFSLAHATVYLANAQKSNSMHTSIDMALDDVRNGFGTQFPTNMIKMHPSYKYPHAYPNKYVHQQYMPHDLDGRQYYEVKSQNEYNAWSYWDNIKKNTPK